jgi:RNA polymerase sigma-70 factor (ECF subfamily)
MADRASAAQTEAARSRDRDWEKLRVEAARQNPGQFGPLYEAHFDVVYAYVARRVRERSEAEDVTSEIFRKALDGIAGFEWQGAPFAAWLLRIASNTLADRARRALRVVPTDPTVDADQVAAAVDADAVERAELFRLVGELPAEQRRVIELRFAEERSIRDIAAELGRTEGAVKQLQLRALQSLRKKIRKDHA